MNVALKKAPVRPVIITIICILGFILYAILIVLGIIALIGGALISGIESVPAEIAGVASSVVLIMAILLLVAAILSLWALIGYWKMRRWGPIMFTVLVVLSIIMELVSASFLASWSSIVNLIINIIVIAIGFIYYNRMT
jgi:hypothetical protein